MLKTELVPGLETENTGYIDPIRKFFRQIIVDSYSCGNFKAMVEAIEIYIDSEDDLK